jgi:hypothetical protein
MSSNKNDGDTESKGKLTTDQVWERATWLDWVTKKYRKNFFLASAIFSIPTAYVAFLTIFFPHPILPEFTEMTIYCIALLYVFVHLAALAHYLWYKKTFYDFFTKFRKLIEQGIVKAKKKSEFKEEVVDTDPDKRFKAFEKKYKDKSNEHNTVITIFSIALGAFMAAIACIYEMQYFQDIRLPLWTVNWVIVFTFVAYFVCMGIKKIFLAIQMTAEFASNVEDVREKKRIRKNEKNDSAELGYFSLDLNPIHPDGFGGLEGIGEIAIETSFLVTLIVLVFPWVFEMVRLFDFLAEGVISLLLIIVFGFAVIMFIITFTVPTFKIYQKAKKGKDTILNDASEIYKDALDDIKKVIDEARSKKDYSNPSIIALGTITNIEMENYRETRQMKVFPFSKTILVKLTTGLLIPLIQYLIQEFLI